MRWIALLIFIFPLWGQTHEIQTITQHVNMRKQKQSGWQQDVLARIKASDNFDIGAQATYLERFNLFDERVGGFVIYRPDDHQWSLEARYLQGMGNEILPERQTVLSGYYSLGQGLSPYLYYNDSRYSTTTVHTVNAGVEIEKFPGFIIIPSLMMGKASFNAPEETKDVHSYGLRVVYYQEKKFAISAFAYQGKEASQGIIGESSSLVDTLTGGLGLAYFFTPDFKSELTFDHTDYDQLGTEFHTTTLNLSWMF